MFTETKVMIAGGGPAGSSAARVLARHGIETLVLDKNPPGVKPCGGGIPMCGTLDIPPGLIKFRTNRLLIVPPVSAPFEIEMEEGSIAMVERPEFDGSLRELARKEGAEFLTGALLGVRAPQRGGKITARVLADGSEVEMRSDYLIAADGVNSRVRSSLGLAPLNSLMTLSGKFPKNSSDSDLCEFHFGTGLHGGYAWVFPSASALSIGAGSPEPRRLKKCTEDFFKSRGISLNGGTKKNPLRGYRIPLWEKESARAPLVLGKVLFAGDAAGLVMPLTFEGIYYAMRSGEMAAECIIKDDPEEYRRLWNGNFQARYSIMRRLWGYFSKKEANMEKLISALRSRVFQQAAMQVWLNRAASRKNLLAFICALRKSVNII